MRLAILASKNLESGEDVLLEYKEEEVRVILKDLLLLHDFDTAWSIIVNKLKQRTVKL